MATGTVKAVWVTGKFEGMAASHVLAHPHSYCIFKSGGAGLGKFCIAAFRKVLDGPLDHHLSVITDVKVIEKLNNWEGKF